MMAESRMPAINAGKMLRESEMKIIFCLSASKSVVPISVIRPSNAITMTAPRERTTQVQATMADFFAIEGFLMDMKRPRMWGIPK